MTESIADILVRRDGLSREVANDLVEDMRRQVLEGSDDPEELLYEYGLEPDYVDELLF
jgi:hypothetical protein